MSLIVYPAACLKLESLEWSNNVIDLLECTLFRIETASKGVFLQCRITRSVAA